MNKSKKIFLAAVAVFLVILLLISIDISRKTTFPGSKKNLKERIENDIK